MAGDRCHAYVATVPVPTLRPGDVVVMGHLPCHTSARVRAATEGAGCEFRFLPAYSPDLNPIELAFARPERLLRSDGHRTAPTLTRFPDMAAKVFSADECAAHIRHCGYGREPATMTAN